ncbi:hypothetical protein [Actinoplanes sp. DH11]|uniref:hypothetical protein n=1 Tax=Actinoplanes sp. DH11 TaxID=2857011 RepID=UPI001E4370FB|nr:hypothetical protein [Actinoplanes sp. DH11]
MRMSVPAAVAALAIGLALTATPAHAAAAVFVELNPSTAPAGDEISVRASCDDNLKPATVTAEPIGDVTVQPEFGFLTATVRVPAETEPGDYPVRLACPDGGGVATATLHVVAKVEPTRGPATGGGGTAGSQVPSILVGGGLAAIAAALVLGVVSVRRRRLG